MYCRMFTSISDFYSLDDNSKLAQMSPGGLNGPWLKITDLRCQIEPSPLSGTLMPRPFLFAYFMNNFIDHNNYNDCFTNVPYLAIQVREFISKEL